MAARTLSGPPSILPLYARAAAPLLPGASLLPFVPGGGGEMPELELVLTGVRAEPERVAAYARVCGFALRDSLPPTYPHVLAFPLQMATMADGSFPFGAIGLVHLENRIEQRRPIGVEEELTLRVRPTPLRPHPKGQTFSLLTEAFATADAPGAPGAADDPGAPGAAGDPADPGAPAWSSESTMLHRGPSPADVDVAVVPAMREEVRHQAAATWRLDGGLGRRYAGVSGDRNPIHIHSLTAKPLGFPAAIAHGMWTKARCLAALGGLLPDAFSVEVSFRKPILLPATVEFASEERDGGSIAFAVRDPKRQTPHLDGLMRPVAGKGNDEKHGRTQ